MVFMNVIANPNGNPSFTLRRRRIGDRSRHAVHPVVRSRAKYRLCFNSSRVGRRDTHHSHSARGESADKSTSMRRILELRRVT